MNAKKIVLMIFSMKILPLGPARIVIRIVKDVMVHLAINAIHANLLLIHFM